MLPPTTPGAPEASSTQRLIADDKEEKEAYFGSFEQDSFDLEDCFSGDTQPQNSSLLQKRVAERQSLAVASKSTTPESEKTALPTPAGAEILSRESLVNSANTPLKFPAIPKFADVSIESPLY